MKTNKGTHCKSQGGGNGKKGSFNCRQFVGNKLATSFSSNIIIFHFISVTENNF